MKPIEMRLHRLERSRGMGWEGFRHVPMHQWPDAALWALLGLQEGSSDAELQRSIEAAEAKDRQP